MTDKIYYICDKKACAKSCIDCAHTSNIKHAKNFQSLNDGSYWETCTNLNTNKKDFVNDYLNTFIKLVDNSIEGIAYELAANNEEFVNIQYKSGHIAKVCITADSYVALCRDVFACL